MKKDLYISATANQRALIIKRVNAYGGTVLQNKGVLLSIEINSVFMPDLLAYIKETTTTKQGMSRVSVALMCAVALFSLFVVINYYFNLNLISDL